MAIPAWIFRLPSAGTASGLADASADSLVAFTDEAEVNYPGWTLAAENGFWLDTGKPAPEWMRVLVYKHAPSLNPSDPHAVQLWQP